MAERVGFEPTGTVGAQRFSRPSQSTTLAPLRKTRMPPPESGGRSTGGALSPSLRACQACPEPFDAVRGGAQDELRPLPKPSGMSGACPIGAMDPRLPHGALSLHR